MERLQEHIDTFYWRHGPCCAGCDWWRSYNISVGECTKGAPVAAAERWAMLGIDNSSLRAGAGHIMTTRGHCCGDFKDEFDWTALPLAYQRRVGVRPTTPSGGRT